jgi:hypothetical protein
MGNHDWGIVVGVQQYVGQLPADALQGPNRDARAFAAWLRGPGEVPKGQLKVLPSTARPPFPSREPIADALWEVRNRVRDEHGRRLWLYLAGHGIEIRRESVLLTAKAERGRWSEHVPGPDTATWFRLSGLFEEVILVMDCCRTSVDRVDVQRLFDDADEPTSRRTRWMFALATRWSRVARERAVPPDPDVRGVFTSVLLEGLSGAAADGKGLITAGALDAWVRRRMIEVEPGQQPEIQYEPADAEAIVLAQVAPRYTFGRIVVRRRHPAPVRILGPDATEVSFAAPTTEPHVFTAPVRGQYEIEVGARTWRLHMSGADEVIDV